jgi:hypothetical protein
MDSYKYYFCTKLEQGQRVIDTLFQSTIHTNNVKFMLAMGNIKKTMQVIKLSQNKFTHSCECLPCVILLAILVS